MRRRTALKLVAAVAVTFLVILTLPDNGAAQNFEQKYFLLKGESTYQLTLSTTSSLYVYYQQKNHQLTQSNFASFVTPYSLTLVAADIRSIFPDEEEFANAVLTLVHQIPYQIVDEAKYPVETIVENRGDCDLLSFVAASLMKAQELNVVLFYYEQESHMNIGVNLPNPPRNARTTLRYVDYDGARYYVAECTGDDWQNGWRVGEYPPELEGARVVVVPLENYEPVAPGQVSSSFGALESSLISLTISPTFSIEGNTIVMTGQVSVSNPGGTVALYATSNDNWFSVGRAELDSNGRYAFSWNPTLAGQYHVKASWSGDDDYAGADSNVVSIYVIPKLLVYAGGGLIIGATIMFVLLLMHKTTQSQEMATFE